MAFNPMSAGGGAMVGAGIATAGAGFFKVAGFDSSISPIAMAGGTMMAAVGGAIFLASSGQFMAKKSSVRGPP